MALQASRVVALVQARMGSRRLPGKMLAPVAGLPLLELIVRRVAGATRIDELIVATTRLAEDDALQAVCTRLAVKCVRGSVEDCLDRLHVAATQAAAGIVVRLTGDNPVPDGRFVDWVIGEMLARRGYCDYVDTMSHGTFPYGLSAEVLTYDTLDAAWREATDPADREHVTRFVRERPQRFRHCALGWQRDDHDLRLTVDEPQDLQNVRELFEAARRWDIAWEHLIELARVRSASGGQDRSDMSNSGVGEQR